MLKIKNGNLLETNEKYIGHICNCISQNSAGLAAKIFIKFPYSNTYRTRISPDQMGTIKILGNGIDQRYIINMFAQYYPGKSKSFSNNDNLKHRLSAFKKCLNSIIQIHEIKSLALPFKIGCGLGGGNWPDYLELIKEISDKIDITLYEFKNKNQ